MSDIPLYEGGTLPQTRRGHWMHEQQDFAMANLRGSHNDALYAWGEYAMFVLLWSVRDHAAGLVARCPTCYVAFGKMADAFGQGVREKCPDCFGTTFEGGYRAKIVRPTLWTDTSEQDTPTEERRGHVVRSNASLQTTTDFALRNGDYIFRADGTRWQAQQPDDESVSTGFVPKVSHVDESGTMVTAVVRQDTSTVAYIIPPTTEDLIELLSVEPRYPTSFAAAEDIVGSLW